MRNKNIRFTCIVVLFIACITNSCRMMDRADRKYARLAYSKAIPLYKKALAKDSTNARGWARLGDCYKDNNMTDEAEACYARAVQGDDSKIIYKLNYAEMLMSNGKYADAKTMMDQYLKVEPNDTRAVALASGLSHIETFFTDKNYYKVDKLNINTSEAEFCPAFYKEGIVFTSSRQSSSRASGNHAWTGRKYYSIYYSKYAQLNTSSSESNPSTGTTAYTSFEDPVVFLKGVQTKYNNSSVCFNKNGTEMIMTRNEINNENVETWDGVVLKVKLYFSALVNGQWMAVTPFQYNSDSYSCAHPALSPDGSKLYFASDMPGTYGGMDLWVCTRTDAGWSTPRNMGPDVNTKGNELFPTVADDGTIYFSSNGHEGLGGLDIYSTTETNGTYSKPKNLGAPYNSSDDDFGLIVNSASGISYFSSNRTHQGYNDDIYSIKKKIIKLNGIVTDKQTAELLDSVKVQIIEQQGTPEVLETSENGAFTSLMRPDKNYRLIVARANYSTDTLEISQADINTVGDSMSVAIAMSSEISITGKVTNDAIGSTITGAHVMLVNLMSHDTLHTVTDKDGIYSFTNLRIDSRYRVTGESEYCDSKSIDTSTFGMAGNTTLHVNIPLYCLTENIVLNNIYYDLDKSNIRPDAAVQLDKLVSLLKKYPGITIELGSHTDCRASYAYNMRLSQRRATAAVAYLQKSGIDGRRMTAKGYGKSKPVNKCECDGTFMVPCTEEEYQLNRRTEIKIRSLDYIAGR